MTLLLTLIVFAMAFASGLHTGYMLWCDRYARHCRHRYVEGIYGDERNRTQPFVLRCTVCGTLVRGELEEANWPSKYLG